MYPSLPKKQFSPAPLALAAALAITLAHAPRVHAQSGAVATMAPVPLNIPAQPLGQALNALAKQANLQMAFPAALVAGKSAPAVLQPMTVKQALNQLLAGSGLVAELNGNKVLIKADRIPMSDKELPSVEVVDTALEHPSQRVGAQAREAFTRGRSSSTTSGSALSDLSPVNKGDALRHSTTGFVGGPGNGDRFGGGTNIRTFGDWGAAESIAGLPAFKSAGGDSSGFAGSFLPSISIDNVHVHKGGHGVGFGDGTDGGVIEYNIKSGRSYDKHKAITFDASSARETLIQAETGHHTKQGDYYLAGSSLYGNYKREPENLQRQKVTGMLGNFGWNFSDTMRAEVLVAADSSQPDIIRNGALQSLTARQSLASTTLNIALGEHRGLRLGYLHSGSRTQWPARNRDRSINNDIAFAEHSLATTLGQGLRYNGTLGLEYKRTEYLRDSQWVNHFNDVSFKSTNTLTVNDNLGLTAGARLIRLRNDIVLGSVQQPQNLKDKQVLAYELGASHNVTKSTRVRAVVATGFNRFFEKYGNFGTDVLNPKGAGDDVVESRTLEVGVKHALTPRSHIDLAVYRITQNGVPRRNAGAIESMKVEQSGAELELKARLLPTLQLGAGYTRVLSLEATRANGRQVNGNIYWDGQTTAVPKHQAHLRLDWRPVNNVGLWTAAFFSSGYESVRADGSVTENDGFTRLDVGASWALNPRWLLRAKIENLTDERHFGSVVKGVSVPDQGKLGRVFWVGADMSF